MSYKDYKLFIIEVIAWSLVYDITITFISEL